MKLGKKTVSTALIVYLILAALLNLIIFALFKPGELATGELKRVFWFSYGFLMLAFVLQIAAILTGRFESGVESVFFGFPLVSVSLFYFIITAVLSLAFMILVSVGVAVPFMLMFVLECLVLGLYAIAFIISLSHKNVVVEIDKNIKKNVFAIRTLVTDVECLAEAVEDSALKAKLNRLAEDIRYSDPMTNETVAELDLQMKDAIAELEVFVSEQDYSAAEAKIRQAQLIMSKRNKRLADSK